MTIAETVARLDYSKPPPGFDIAVLPSSLTKSVTTASVWDDPNVLAAAWDYCRVYFDPPGAMNCGPLGLYVTFGPRLPRMLSRSAAWAWYDRRHALVGQIVTVLEYGDDFNEDGEREVGQRIETSQARLLDVVGPMIAFGFDKTSELDRMHAEAAVADLMSCGRAEFEGDPPIEMIRFGMWPRCLAWSDEQVAEVEFWLRDSTAEMPEVLRFGARP